MRLKLEIEEEKMKEKEFQSLHKLMLIVLVFLPFSFLSYYTF